MTHPAPGSRDGRAPLTGWQAGALVVGSMIGTGVFTTNGLLSATVGGSSTAVLLVWILGGVIALCGAAVYAEIGGMFPQVGGEYVYLSRAFHPAVGFVSGWLALLVGFAAPVAAGAHAFGRYLQAALPGAVPRGFAIWAGVALVVTVSVIHARDVVWAARLQLVATAMTVLIMLAIVVVGGAIIVSGGASITPVTTAAPAPVTAAGIAVGLVLVSYSYFGWNAAAYVAGELANPQRTLPRALLAGCALVTVVYVAINAVFLAALPPEALAGKVEVAHVVAQALLGEGAARGLSLVIAFVLAGSVSALVMTGPRVYLAMARDRQFFALFGRRNARGAPAAGVWLQGGLALVLLLSAGFDALLLYVGFTLSLSAAATVAATVWLRRTQPTQPRPYRAPLWPLPALLFFALSAWMAVHAALERPRETAAGALTLGAGFITYAFWQRVRGRDPGSDADSTSEGSHEDHR
ncbi:MAG TPA: amino acid permease [Polyangia bacterium]